jgi:Flp pilus assembly protein TadG
MASLARLVLVRLRRDERGVVAVIVAILLGAGVLTGMVALVLDVGQIYQERAELQNGADAAALGVAKSCALGWHQLCRRLHRDANCQRFHAAPPGFRHDIAR